MLLKKSDIYDSFKFTNKFRPSEDDYEIYETFKDPTNDEIEITRKQSKWRAIRGVIYDNGTKMIWAGDILHNNIAIYANNPLDMSGFRFSWDPDNAWIIDAHFKYEFEEIKDLIIKYEPFLSKIGNTYSKFYIYATKNGSDEEFFI